MLVFHKDTEFIDDTGEYIKAYKLSGRKNIRVLSEYGLIDVNIWRYHTSYYWGIHVDGLPPLYVKTFALFNDGKIVKPKRGQMVDTRHGKRKILKVEHLIGKYKGYKIKFHDNPASKVYLNDVLVGDYSELHKFRRS